MQYNDLEIAIDKRSGAGYPVSVTGQGFGHITGRLPLLDNSLKALLAQACQTVVAGRNMPLVRKAGSSLFQWLVSGPVEGQFRVAWDRAERAKCGLRIRLTLDSPAMAALPWELLYDPLRNHAFATSVATPLVRYLKLPIPAGKDPQVETEPPLHILLVLPHAPDLNAAHERRSIEQALGPLGNAVKLTVLEGPVTRAVLSDMLMARAYQIVQITSHGATSGAQSYVSLNRPDGSPDWVNANALARLFANQHQLKLVVLNACSSGQVDEGAALRGLAPQLIETGVPAVVAMQMAISDDAAHVFSTEFYKQLTSGENVGQVDVSLSHARNMLAVTNPDSACFAAPVLYTYIPDGVIFSLPQQRRVQEILDPSGESARLAMFVSSVQAGLEFEEDWQMAEPAELKAWREKLLWAERAYRSHLDHASAGAQQAARQGLSLIRARLSTLEAALAESEATGLGKLPRQSS